jgi:hypothetical protein
MEVLEGDCHAVVFDVNVYLRIADVIGSPFTWAKFNQLAITHANDPLPHPSDPRIDSVRAMAVSRSGSFAGTQSLEVWTSDHIDALVLRKLTQPPEQATPEESGYGWSHDDAVEAQRRLIDDVVYDDSNGGTLGAISIALGTPPLDHEDGCVYATAMGCAPDETDFYHRYLVTADKQFKRDEQALSSDVQIFLPHEWVELVRGARLAVSRSAGRVPPPPTLT